MLRRQDRRAETLALRHYPPVICTHVAGEFLFGQAHAKVSAAAFQAARDFLDSFEMLRPTASTATIYGRIRAQLLDRGVTLPDPDYWIAAHALENQMPLLSSDSDFRHVPEIRLHLLSPRTAE